MNIFAMTSGQFTPSTRFRIRQHIVPLSKHGIEVCENYPLWSGEAPSWWKPDSIKVSHFPPAWPLYSVRAAIKIASRIPDIFTARHADILWLSRSLYPGLPTFERFLPKPVVLDIDDSVWQTPPFGVKQLSILASHADVITAGNSYLADWCSKFNKNIKILPTAIDTKRFFPKINSTDKNYIVGWTGTSRNYKYLYAISDALNIFFDHNPSAVLRIIADKPPLGIDLPKAKIDFRHWSEENEAKLVQSMHVGIMPLPLDDWTRGKCSFKMLQYMACGLPVVVSPVGMNMEILGRGNVGISASSIREWTDALVHLAENQDISQNLGAQGRIIVNDYYSREVVTKRLIQIFESI